MFKVELGSHKDLYLTQMKTMTTIKTHSKQNRKQKAKEKTILHFTLPNSIITIPYFSKNYHPYIAASARSQVAEIKQIAKQFFCREINNLIPLYIESQPTQTSKTLSTICLNSRYCLLFFLTKNFLHALLL